MQTILPLLLILLSILIGVFCAATNELSISARPWLFNPYNDELQGTKPRNLDEQALKNYKFKSGDTVYIAVNNIAESSEHGEFKQDYYIKNLWICYYDIPKGVRLPPPAWNPQKNDFGCSKPIHKLLPEDHIIQLVKEGEARNDTSSTPPFFTEIINLKDDEEVKQAVQLNSHAKKMVAAVMFAAQPLSALQDLASLFFVHVEVGKVMRFEKSSVNIVQMFKTE